MDRIRDISGEPAARPQAVQPPSVPSDAELMADLACGRMQALGQLVRRHQDRVRSLAYRITGKWDAADDVCQDAFLRVYRSAGNYHPDAAFTTWLHRIVVNLCLDRAKRRWWPSLVGREPADIVSAADGDLMNVERAEAVRRAIARLPERQRVALVLHRFEGQSHGQIAQTTGWSDSAVESLLVRAYAQLRRDLDEWKEGPQ